MSLSRRSIDMLMDLIENRIACMQVVDREDHRQLAILTQARREIQTLTGSIRREVKAAVSGEEIATPAPAVASTHTAD